MWIEQVGTKYKYCDRWHGKKVCVTLPGKSAKYHRQASAILMGKIERLKTESQAKLTLKELSDLYLKWKAENYKEQSVLSTSWHLNRILELLGEDTYIDEITPTIYKKKMAEKPTTYNDRLKYFKAMYHWAYQNEYIAVDICDRLPKMKTTPVRIRNAEKYLEHDELALLLDSMNEYWGLFTKLLVLTGMRVGEAIDLTIDDVDKENRLIDINSTFSLALRRSSSVKTETSNRQIYIQDELMDVIERIEALRGDFPPSKTFFPSLHEKTQYDSYRKYLREHSEKVLGRKVTPHIFRHTHTALLAEAGIQLEQISRRLGHSDSKVTREVYLHITERMKEKENERLRNLCLLPPVLPPEEK